MIYATAPARALEELSFYIGRAYYNYKLLLERTLRGLGLERLVSPGMGHLLFALFEEDDCIIRDLAEQTKLSLPTLTVMLRKMEAAGLVRSRRDPDDGRAVRIRLTPLGRSIQPRCEKVLARLNSVLGTGLAKKDVTRAKTSLARMIENMRRDEESSGG
jgi:DNA-binding MarR family transcriptional regulator